MSEIQLSKDNEMAAQFVLNINDGIQYYIFSPGRNKKEIATFHKALPKAAEGLLSYIKNIQEEYCNGFKETTPSKCLRKIIEGDLSEDNLKKYTESFKTLIEQIVICDTAQKCIDNNESAIEKFSEFTQEDEEKGEYVDYDEVA